MSTGRVARRGLRWAGGRWWADVRPGRASDWSHLPVDEAPRDGTPPRPDQSFVPATEPTGPWAGIDPRVTGAWQSRLASSVGIGVWAFVGFRVRRQVAELVGGRGRGGGGGEDPGGDDDGPTGSSGS